MKEIKAYVWGVMVMLVSCVPPYSEELESIVGVAVKVDRLVFDVNDWEYFGGEGFSLSVYELSEETVKRFVDSDRKELYPQKSLNWKWESFPWKRTPLKKEYAAIRSILNTCYRDDRTREVVQKFDAMLDDDRNYHAFCYRDDLEDVRDVYFYLMNPELETLYVFHWRVD